MQTGRNAIKANDIIQGVAEETGYTWAQVVLRWALQNDVMVVPRSANPAHIRGKLLFTFNRR